MNSLSLVHLSFHHTALTKDGQLTIKQLMCDIAVCIAKAQDNAEMDRLVYEIKLGASIVSLSTEYCKLHSLNVCILFSQAWVYIVFTSMGTCFCLCRWLQTDICASDNLQLS